MARRNQARLGLFHIGVLTSGDFAFNLYWQCVTFFLLFFYTDILIISPVVAGAIYAAGSVVDAAADLFVGILAERLGHYKAFIQFGAIPLALTFCALFVPGLAHLGNAIIILVAIHGMFRLLYALVNVPYASLSASMTDDSRERGLIAGGRMLFGAGAAITVALVVRYFARAAEGGLIVAPGYAAAAGIFGIVGTAMLLVMVAVLPASHTRAARPGGRFGLAQVKALAGNRAFVTLVTAAAAITIAGGAINASVIYYFTYVVRQPLAGPIAIAWMGMAGAAAVPGWMLLRARLGTRSMWLVDACLGVVLIAGFALVQGRSAAAATGYFCGMQIVMIGFIFAFWAMLPDTVEWGEHQSGIRVEALAFGVGLVAQKLALGLASLLLGTIYQNAGYAVGVDQQLATTAAIRATMLILPATAIILSALFILANPLRRNTHASLIAALASHPRSDLDA